MEVNNERKTGERGPQRMSSVPAAGDGNVFDEVQ